MSEFLSDLQLFSGYEKEGLELIRNYIILKNFKKGETVMNPEQAGDDLFIVLTGNVTGTLSLPGSIDRKHAEYGRGDAFGGLSLFGGKKEYDVFTASIDSELLLISRKSFEDIIEKNPEVSIKLISNLLSYSIMQLRKSSRFLADVVEWGEKASRRVITDELTGLYNRAFLDDAIENFFNISQSNNKPLSFMMLDVDNFREINEAVGHDAGNGVIIEFAGIIRRIISKHGIMARYGGDEFSILLPETDLFNACEMAELIRERVESFDFSKHFEGKKIPVTTSIGVCSYPETAQDITTFRQKADESLYKAKESGRNRVKCIE